MRVEITPSHVTVAGGQSVVLTIQVFNSSQVISAHRIRVLGIDERWMTLDNDQLSLFPDTSGIVTATITLPRGIPAGTRQLTVSVAELTPPQRTITATADLTVPAEAGARISLEPVSTSGGSTAAIGVVLENDGNSELDLRLDGIDEEDKVQFAFEPPVLHLGPGDRVTVAATLRARRPFAGSPKARTFIVRALGTDPPIETFGSFVQRPRLSRGALGLLGLLLAVTVFALVITSTLNRVVDRSAADRDLALQVIQGERNGTAGAAGSVAGKVTLLTSGKGVGGVTVQAFPASNTTTPAASIATADDGGYALSGLSAGDYKLRFQGAGFVDLWYPQSLTVDNAKTVSVQANAATTGIDVRLGGLPGKIDGTVVGSDPTGATVTLREPGADAATLTAPVTPAGGREAPSIAQTPTTAAPSTTSATDSGGALVTSTIVAADGAFHLDQVPSPSTYDLVVQKEGFATEVQPITLNAGEDRSGVEITLRKGDGTISGHITSANGPVGGATITATDGSATSATVSLTQDDVGSFTLRNLPTPATFTVLISKSGFASQTLTLSLAAGQQLTGVVAAVNGGSGSISGTARDPAGNPLGGVAVTATSGSVSLHTVTSSVSSPSNPLGSYTIAGLAIPDTYTVTFSRPDLASATQAVQLDQFGRRDVSGVDATLGAATGAVQGTVREQFIDPDTQQQVTQGVGEVSVTLSGGPSTYQTKTASNPASLLGSYSLSSVPPGTYSITFSRTGAASVSYIISVTAGQVTTQDTLIDHPASIIGSVGDASTQQPLPNAEVVLYKASDLLTPLQRKLTNPSGVYEFDAIQAPDNYVLEFAYPAGTDAKASRTITNLPSGQQTVVPQVLLSTS